MVGGYQISSPGQRTLTARDKQNALRKAQVAANRTRRPYAVYRSGVSGSYLEAYIKPEGQR
jgi:hypothetical protein